MKRLQSTSHGTGKMSPELRIRLRLRSYDTCSRILCILMVALFLLSFAKIYSCGHISDSGIMLSDAKDFPILRILFGLCLLAVLLRKKWSLVIGYLILLYANIAFFAEYFCDRYWDELFGSICYQVFVPGSEFLGTAVIHPAFYPFVGLLLISVVVWTRELAVFKKNALQTPNDDTEADDYKTA